MDVRDIREGSEGMKYGEIKNLVSDSGEIYNANKDFVTLNAWKKAREVKLFFYNKIIPNPDKPRGIQIQRGKPEPKKRKLKAHPDFSGCCREISVLFSVIVATLCSQLE